MSASPPSTLGKYQIIREIARSNDIVYEAYDPLMNRRVALKELAIPGGSTDTQRDERIRRFQREVRAAGSLAHPNIVTIFEVGEEGGRHFMAMEFLEGRTLRNEVDTKGILPEARAVEVACDVLRALQFAHERGVVHRDVKPENIQILPDGRVKLTDFGIARLTFEPNLTMDGQVFGTPSYMSPEQVVGKEIDARSDLFSVGVVLYEMLAGAKPFSGDSVVSITYSIMNAHPSAPAQASHNVWSVVQRALDKTPAMRPPSAERMIEELETAMRQPAAPPALSGHPGFQMPTGAYAPAPPAGPPPAPTYGVNPYTVPYQHAPYPPPASGYGQPYSPTGQMGSGQVYQAQPVPIYYPPPPRQPLLKPETKLLLAKLFFTILILATLCYAVVMMVKNVSERSMPPARKVMLPPEAMDVSREQAEAPGSTVQPQAPVPTRPSPEPFTPRTDNAAAERLFREGMGAIERNDLMAARDLFSQARALAEPGSPVWEEATAMLDRLSR